MPVSKSRLSACVAYVRGSLAARADPEKAAGMQAYMKTDMPFYGVQKPGRVEILRTLVREYPPADREEYESLVLALWALAHREEKYLAQGLAFAFPEFIVPESMTIYERFVVDGAWWDLVDEAATHPIRHLVLEFGDQTWPVIDRWNEDRNMWKRRVSLICQVGAKQRTDAGRLFRYCLARAHEREFFIRKAIGWALRDYAYVDPEAVARFVTANRERLSGLSFREASKHIGHLVGS
jgi:3-methyladenine DNA glycosylase AlkD